MTPDKTDCPYGAASCPKVNELEDRLGVMEHNQLKMMRTLYYIVGVVSVSLGLTGGMLL